MKTEVFRREAKISPVISVEWYNANFKGYIFFLVLYVSSPSRAIAEDAWDNRQASCHLLRLRVLCLGPLDLVMKCRKREVEKATLIDGELRSETAMEGRGRCVEQ